MSVAIDEQASMLPAPEASAPVAHVRSRPLLSGLTPAQRFMIASFAILLAGMAGIGWWISTQIERSVLNRTAFTTALYVDSFVAGPLQELVSRDTLSPAAVAELRRLLDGTALGKEVVAFKVWNREGEVIYSADPALIGRRFPIEGELQYSLNGRVAAELSDLDEAENVNERTRADRLLEIYSPVRAEGDGRVIASVEFYQRVDELEALIAGAQQRSWLIVLAVTAAMYLLLGGYVHRSSRTIVRQDAELQAQVARLTEVLAQNEELTERLRRAAARATAYNERLLRRISAELHDGPAQYLGLAILRLDRVAAAVEQLPAATTTLGDDLDAIQSSLTQAMQEVRAISAGIGLPQLDQLSLAEVASRAVRAHERRTRTSVDLCVADLPEQAHASVKIAVYRVIQEGLNNATHHAGGAGQRVELRSAGDSVQLWVTDAGPGFAPPPPGDWGEHMGLAGMRERVESLGGEFALLSQPGDGTRIFASIPLQIRQELL